MRKLVERCCPGRSCGLLLLLVILVSLVTGCWSRVEIENMSFISVIGVDSAGRDGFLVSFQFVNPRALAKGGPGGGGGGGGEPPVFVLSVTARTLPDALARLAEESSRTVSLKQVSAIVLGEGLARQGIGEVVDFFARHWELRRTNWVLVAKGDAQRILMQGAPVLEKVPGMAIRMEMEHRALLSSTRYPVTLNDFLIALTRPGIDNLISSVEIGPMQEKKSGGAGKQVEKGNTKEKATDGKKELVFRGAGVFRKGKLVGFLGPQETRGVRWLQGKIQGGVLTVPVKSRGTWASLVTSRATARVRPVVTATGIRYQVSIRDEGYI